jgi:carboxymethylenebutenolidase
MHHQTVSIPSANATRFDGYLVLPKNVPAPGIVLIQEIFGINSFVRQMAHFFAESGYIALAPDLFWRFEPGMQLDDQDTTDRARAFELYEDFCEDDAVDDLISTLNILCNHPACNGTVGCVGFCLGGKLAYLMSTRSDIDCSVGYYGVGIEHDLSEGQSIRRSLLLHLAAQDEFVSPEAQATIHAQLGENPLVTLHTYPDVSHAFARENGNNYNAQAAKLANDRTLTFLKQYLGKK